MPGTRKSHPPFVFRCSTCAWTVTLHGRETTTSVKLCPKCGVGWMELERDGVSRPVRGGTNNGQ